MDQELTDCNCYIRQPFHKNKSTVFIVQEPRLPFKIAGHYTQVFTLFSNDRCEKQERKLRTKRTLRLLEILNETDERKLPD